MPETAGGIGPLNWPALVAEAIRRRKAEKLTQKEHAALASVSVPTIIAFDRGERTLSLGKAMDILRVVGLIEKAPEGGTQEAFVQDAVARWRELIKDLPKTSPGRFPTGWYRIDYALDGEIKEFEQDKFEDVLRNAIVPHTTWPMFQLNTRLEDLTKKDVFSLMKRFSRFRPERQIGGSGESVGYWFPPGDAPGVFRPYDSNPAHCDFWTAAPSGRMFLIRGYLEDSQETFPPGTIFDTILPIWQIGEAFLHAARLARLIVKNSEQTTVHLRVLYTGLQGRDLRAWANPAVIFYGGERARTDEATLEGSATVSAIETNLATLVLPMAASLLERFGVTGTALSFVEVELERMRQNHVSTSDRR